MKEVLIGSFYNRDLKEESFKTLTARQWLKEGHTVVAQVKEKGKWRKTAPLKSYKGPVLIDNLGKKFRIIGVHNPTIEVIFLEFYNSNKKKKSSWRKQAQKWLKNGDIVKVRAFNIEFKTRTAFGPVEEIDLKNNIVKLLSGEKLHWS